MREQFENLPEIKKRIASGVYWNESIKMYRQNGGSCRGATFINGAWYAFQEQQEKIARLQSGLDELKKTCNDVLDLGISDEFERGWDRAHHRVLSRIEGITGTSK